MSEQQLHRENGPEIGKEGLEQIVDRSMDAMKRLREKALDGSGTARRILLAGAALIGLAAAGEARAQDYHNPHGNGVSFNAEARTQELSENLKDIEAELAALRKTLKGYEAHPSQHQADIHRVEARIKVLEKQETRAEAAMDVAAEKWTERRATQPKKVIDIAERATDETNAIIVSFGIVVEGNTMHIPVGGGLYHDVTLGPDVADIGFPVRTTRELRIVLHKTDRSYYTIRVTRDPVTGMGVYAGDIEESDVHGYELSH